MPKLKTLCLGPIAGKGRTLSEARADLNAQLEQAVTGSYEPAIISYNGYHAVVSRTAWGGWQYRTYGPERPLITEGVTDAGGCVMLGNVSRNEAIQSAAFHVVQLGCPLFTRDDEIPAFLADPRRRRDLLSWCRWQRAYRYAQQNRPEGRSNEHEWHEWACWHASDPMFAA